MRIVVCLVVCFVGPAGCNPISLGRRGLAEILGARGDCKVVREASSVGFAQYKAIRIGTVDSDIGTLCKPEMIDALRQALAALPDQLIDTFAGQDPALTIHATIIWHQPGGGVRAVLGNDAMCIVRTELRAAEDEAVADLRLIASSSAITRSTDDDLADALAKALAEYLEGKIPKHDEPT